MCVPVCVRVHVFLCVRGYVWGGGHQVSNRLKETGSLRCIRLCDNAIDEGIEYLVPVLHNLTELDLSYNQVSAAGISVLADHLRSSSCKVCHKPEILWKKTLDRKDPLSSLIAPRFQGAGTFAVARCLYGLADIVRRHCSQTLFADIEESVADIEEDTNDFSARDRASV